MNRIRLIYILVILLGAVSCSKDTDEDGNIEKEDLIGTWTATSGKYNLSLEFTLSDYDFRLSEPGKGGIYDIGTYDISDDGRITLISNDKTVLAMGQLYEDKLSLTFVNMLAISMLGTGAASNTVFTRTDDDSTGFLVIQNLSPSTNIVKLDLYDGKGNFIDSDSEDLEPDYQITYEIGTGSYVAKVTDEKGKTFTSASFKVVKDKATVLGYTGSALNVLATGVDLPE